MPDVRNQPQTDSQDSGGFHGYHTASMDAAHEHSWIAAEIQSLSINIQEFPWASKDTGPACTPLDN